MMSIRIAKTVIFGLALVTLASSGGELDSANTPNMLCSCIERGIDPRDPRCRPIAGGPGMGEVAGMPNGANGANGVLPPGMNPPAQGRTPSADH